MFVRSCIVTVAVCIGSCVWRYVCTTAIRVELPFVLLRAERERGWDVSLLAYFTSFSLVIGWWLCCRCIYTTGICDVAAYGSFVLG